MKIYVDSNLFISYWDREYGRNIENFLEYVSGEILNRTVSCEFSIIISDLTVKEIKRRMVFSDEELNSSLRIYKDMNKLTVIEGTEAMWSQAKKISNERGVHMSDAMHTVFAKEAGAVLVTWNVKDFVNVKDLITVRHPREL
jgi:predicted nucleic acid-binding protein